MLVRKAGHVSRDEKFSALLSRTRFFGYFSLLFFLLSSCISSFLPTHTYIYLYGRCEQPTQGVDYSGPPFSAPSSFDTEIPNTLLYTVWPIFGFIYSTSRTVTFLFPPSIIAIYCVYVPSSPNWKNLETFFSSTPTKEIYLVFNSNVEREVCVCRKIAGNLFG